MRLPRPRVRHSRETAQLPPGWYPEPSGKSGKQYWDGMESHTTVPAAHRHGGPNLAKIVMGVGVLAMLAGGAIGTAVGWLNSGSRGSTASPTAGPDTPAPTSTRPYLSDKEMATDGIYRVGGDQVDPGVWESTGPTGKLPGHCAWARLSAPELTVPNTIEAGGSDAGPARVRILPSDTAFSTHGCQPWHLVAQ